MKNIESVVQNIIEGEDKNLVPVIIDLVTKINKLKMNTITNIAKLIDYQPQKTYVEPLVQGKVFYYVKSVCKELGIVLEQNKDGLGGLAYFYEFSKLK